MGKGGIYTTIEYKKYSYFPEKIRHKWRVRKKFELVWLQIMQPMYLS